MSVAYIGREHVNENAIRTISSAGESIFASVKASEPISAKVICVSRSDPILENMEKLLNLWTVSQVNKISMVDNVAIRERELDLYNHIINQEGGTSTSRFRPAKLGLKTLISHRKVKLG